MFARNVNPGGVRREGILTGTPPTHLPAQNKMKMLRPQYTFNTAARLHPARHPFVFLTFFILFLFLTFNNLHSTTHITVNNIIKSPPERDHKLYVGRQIPTPAQKPTSPTISTLPRFQANGLLEVSSDTLQRHPIHDLISYAEEEWNRKLKRASKTLEEAVTEYERRYGRSPPRGFDKWWEYVKKHNVQLPDEYDQIHRDLQPFWGMSPADLNRIAREFEAHKDSYTLAKGPSVSDPAYDPAHSDSEAPIIKLVNSSLPEDRFDFHMDGALSIIMLLEDVEEDLSPFRAVFVPHDNPEHAFDWEVKQFALHNAAYGTHMDAFDTSIPPSSHGWLSSCDPLSTARQKPIDFTAPPPPPEGKSFIYDHRKVMDPCEHPSLLRSHGQFLAYHQGHQPHGILYPNFAYSPSMLHQDITLAHTISWRADEEADKEEMPEWDEKTDDRLEWRGKNTGIWFGADYDWHLSHRARLMEWANGGENGLVGNVTILTEEEVEGHAKLESITVNRTQYAPAMLDIGFVEGPEGQCSERVCPKLLGLYDFHRRPHSQKQTSQYKYIIDVDGNAWSARFHRLLLKTNSLIFKSTVYPEWWADRVQPWVHYVPVQNDYSDLWDSLVFFRGKLDGRGKHEEEAKKIAQAGKEWARTFWRKEDMTAYNFRLFLEYARVMSPNRTHRDWNYILPPRRRVS